MHYLNNLNVGHLGGRDVAPGTVWVFIFQILPFYHILGTFHTKVALAEGLKWKVTYHYDHQCGGLNSNWRPLEYEMLPLCSDILKKKIALDMNIIFKKIIVSLHSYDVLVFEWSSSIWRSMNPKASILSKQYIFRHSLLLHFVTNIIRKGHALYSDAYDIKTGSQHLVLSTRSWILNFYRENDVVIWYSRMWRILKTFLNTLWVMIGIHIGRNPDDCICIIERNNV